MRRLFPWLLLAAPLLAQHPAARIHLIDPAGGPLTPPSTLPPGEIAANHVRVTARAAGLGDADVNGLYVAKEYQTAHNGVTHFVYKQKFLGADVYGAAWVVNLAPDGSVLNSGGTLYAAPAAGTLPPEPATALRAVRSAVTAVAPAAAERFIPLAASGARAANAVRFAGSSLPAGIDGETVWYPVNGKLRPAWRFSLTGEDDADYEAVVDNETQAVFERHLLTLYQSPQPPRGLVYDRDSPYPLPNPGVLVTERPAGIPRVLQSFAGDPAASPAGWVSANETSGNNTVTGENLSATNFFATPKTAVAANRDFSFPLELGPGINPLQYTDAATTNLFFWINRAHDLFYLDGFDEPAGNYQRSNFGKGGIEGDPILAYSHYGASANGSASLNNSSYSTRSQDDGSVAAVRMYLGTLAGGFYTDGSLDNQVILHEFTHGVSTRLVRNLGSTYQGASMGEAWSDFFSMEYMLPEGAPPDGSYAPAEYLFDAWGPGIRTRPYSTSLDINPLTYRELGRVSRFLDVHSDGEIWVEALWEARANLIRQFGEKEGRRRIRLLVIDGMKLSPPAPSMVDARDAILLADRVDFKGASQDQLWAAFAKRGLGVLARSASTNLHVLPSFETPSARTSMRFYDKSIVMGEPATLVLYDSRTTAPYVTVLVLTGGGDRETLRLRRVNGVYSATIATSGSASSISLENGSLQLIPGDTVTAFYTEAGEGGRQVTAATAAQLPYALVTRTAAEFKFAGETAVFPGNSGAFNTSIAQKLPFEFPYFGRKYRAVQVYSSGAIGFDLPIFGTCADRDSFAQMNALAPLFGEFVLGGGTQPSQNVYRSQQTPDSITFRWAAETFSSPPAPVNFAATLFSDGRIQYQYGAGNQGLGNVGSSFGCANPGPTVGLSIGHGSYAQFTSLRNYESTTLIEYRPPFNYSSAPVATVEAPAPGDRVQTALAVRGIAYDSQEFIARIDVLIDGVFKGRTTPSVNRTDFCGSQSVNGCPRVGFAATLNLAALGIDPGPHTLQLLVTNTRGATIAAPGTSIDFVVDPDGDPGLTAVIEKPAAADTIAGNVAVAGYTYLPGFRITALDLLVDGLTYGSTAPALTRNDICSSLTGVPNCPNPGFSINLNTVSGPLAMANGDHTLQLRLRDDAGRTFLAPGTPVTVTVKNPDRPNPVAAIESPKSGDTVSGIVRVGGYAYVPGGRITGFTFTVDRVSIPGGVMVVNGDERPDVCANAPSGTACPAVGYHLDLDTRLLTNGPHTMQLTVITDQGARLSVPPGLTGGLAFTVANN